MHTLASRDGGCARQEAFWEERVGVRVTVAGASGYAGGELLRFTRQPHRMLGAIRKLLRFEPVQQRVRVTRCRN